MSEHITTICVTAVVLAIIAALGFTLNAADVRRAETIGMMVQAGAEPMTAACAYDGGSYYLHGNCLSVRP